MSGGGARLGLVSALVLRVRAENTCEDEFSFPSRLLLRGSEASVSVVSMSPIILSWIGGGLPGGCLTRRCRGAKYLVECKVWTAIVA